MSGENYRRVKWGLIGAGDFGLIYAQIMKQLPNVELVSIFSRTEKNAKRAAQNFGIPKYYTDFNELINSDGVEAVAVVTDEHHHYEPVMAALKAGKHVIVEKPIAPTLQQADEMIAQSKKTDKVFAVAHILPFHNHYAMAKAEIDRVYESMSSATVLGANINNIKKGNSVIESR